MGDMKKTVNFAACQFTHLAVFSLPLHLQCNGMNGHLSLLPRLSSQYRMACDLEGLRLQTAPQGAPCRDCRVEIRAVKPLVVLNTSRLQTLPKEPFFVTGADTRHKLFQIQRVV